jgi:hypothetical protein
MLTAIALLLGVIAFRPSARPQRVFADETARDVYIEPGVYQLRTPDGTRSVLGKVVVDLRTGKIWGYPTLSDSPYPISALHSGIPTSTPFLVGILDLSAMDR